MPVIDGFRLYQQLKQIDSKPKVLLLQLFISSTMRDGTFQSEMRTMGEKHNVILTTRRQSILKIFVN
jgi:hypothetical protein